MKVGVPEIKKEKGVPEIRYGLNQAINQTPNRPVNKLHELFKAPEAALTQAEDSLKVCHKMSF